MKIEEIIQDPEDQFIGGAITASEYEGYMILLLFLDEEYDYQKVRI
jgi:hypothetical protein